ncbi:hypothetical protein ACLOJK_025723 [Asimina triloba]
MDFYFIPLVLPLFHGSIKVPGTQGPREKQGIQDMVIGDYTKISWKILLLDFAAQLEKAIQSNPSMPSTHQQDLDLLLSLQDRVLETPPASPSSRARRSPGYLSDDGSPNRRRKVDMSVFKDAVQDYLTHSNELGDPTSAPRSKSLKSLKEINVEKFSGLKIKSDKILYTVRNLLLSDADLSNQFSDVRFIRLRAIGNSLMGDSISGFWATAGVLTEKGPPKKSSNGKTFCVWKMGSLDESEVSVFLFGDAYATHCNEPAGTVFALFNAGVRKDAMGKGFTLSLFSAGQLVKMGTSVDYGVCRGKRKDGMPWYTRASQKYSTLRTELQGGNLRTAFKNRLNAEGIYMVDRLADRSNSNKPVQPVKVMSVDGLKKALSRLLSSGMHPILTLPLEAESKKVIVFPSLRIARATETMYQSRKRRAKNLSERSVEHNQQKYSSEKRSSSSMKVASNIVVENQLPQLKRKKTGDASQKLIELDIVSSEEED